MAEKRVNEEVKKSSLAQQEEEILAFWEEQKIFEKSEKKEAPKGEFVFYEGPPTANGRPGIHHIEARSFKDVIPRYRTMRGYHVRRKGGWDTHGLPVELEVEKKLGLKSKKEIEAYGVAKFNKQCKESVWQYASEWADFTKRIAYWVDLEHPYVTYESPYIESVWNILKTVSGKDLLYKDYKVLPWCPRCGTALSSHELAQGYADVKDISVYAKFELVDEPGTYFLAWTTTPWTLPGNVALAVGEAIAYVKVKAGDDTFIVAKDRLSALGAEHEMLAEMAGKDLVGKKYKPLYPYYLERLPSNEERKYFQDTQLQIYAANFVTTEDGTGIVHIAPMYGADDFNLASEKGLFKSHLVDETGHYVQDTGFLTGKFVKDTDTGVAIIKDLASRNLLFKKESYQHSYPHCWRCKTPLIYYARTSWYVKMSQFRDELVKENEGIHWEPDYIKEGRFGEWLRGIKDWAISRERYWGTPLPIWESESGKYREVIGSISELKEKTKSTNRYFVMRHGEAESNVKNVVSGRVDDPYHLTLKGKEEVEKEISKLKDAGIDLVFASPFVRTKETAEVIADKLGLSKESIVYDDRLREVDTGEFSGKPIAEYRSYFASQEEKFSKPTPGGETLTDLKNRVTEFLYETDAAYADKAILIISHEYPIWLMTAGSQGLDAKGSVALRGESDDFIATGARRELPFAPIPHNAHYELDLHKPYIDDITWKAPDGTLMRRTSEVLDVWFDSGAMPFAQDHYPFENKELIDGSGYPADYISEAIDQTRGWFYTLHAVGVLMGRGKAYKNVICLGHILDAQGKKMSKSQGNTVNPWEMIAKYGVDTLRFWMYGINAPGESKNFDERTVDEVVKKVFNLLFNVERFYEMFAADAKEGFDPRKSPHVLDRWILALFDKLVVDVTTGMDAYDVFSPARAIRDFIGELSQWYIRRSRDRFKSDDENDKQYALATTRYILRELSKVMAPFTPFAAEMVYQKVKGVDGKESVHLETWPQAQTADQKILEDMAKARAIVTLGLEARAKAGIKVRQPLAKLTVTDVSLEGDVALSEVIADEVNVKEIVFDSAIAEGVLLATEITDELKKEGQLRDLVRFVQDVRKKAGLDPHEKVILAVSADAPGKKLVEGFEDELSEAAKLSALVFKEFEKGEELVLDDMKLSVSIEK